MRVLFANAIYCLSLFVGGIALVIETVVVMPIFGVAVVLHKLRQKVFRHHTKAETKAGARVGLMGLRTLDWLATYIEERLITVERPIPQMSEFDEQDIAAAREAIMELSAPDQLMNGYQAQAMARAALNAAHTRICLR